MITVQMSFDTDVEGQVLQELMNQQASKQAMMTSKQ